MDKIISDRRELHRIPELDRDLERTFAYLRSAMKRLHCRVFEPVPGSLCAYFDNGCEKALTFRAGCDALPVQERSFLEFSSQIPGHMHACGHDGHMAILLELARRMNRKTAPCNILLIFQSAEETTGSARDICKSGVFEDHNVEAVFGLQLMPGLPTGAIATRENEVLSRSCEVHVEITGRTCGVMRLSEGVDALDAGMRFYARARALVSERDALLHFGHMKSGSVCNMVSDYTRLEGTLRTYDDALFFDILAELESLGREIGRETGCRVRVETSMGYPPVSNPPELLRRLRDSGIAFENIERPLLLTEDFAWYQRHLPGAFFFLGTGDSPALQADNFNFDESVLSAGADFFESIAFGLRA